jgi:hypothetical protein
MGGPKTRIGEVRGRLRATVTVYGGRAVRALVRAEQEAPRSRSTLISPRTTSMRFARVGPASSLMIGVREPKLGVCACQKSSKSGNARLTSKEATSMSAKPALAKRARFSGP